ncbi:MAG TPA: hypothetical protein VGI16_14800 [Candidatus Acidoferrum sp.]|jgi:hypothetical protein
MPAPTLLSVAPCALFFFYLIAWIRIGRPPKPGPVVTQYDPPQSLSAAAIRFVVTSGSDGRSFAAVIASLCAQGCIRVEPRNGKYLLSRLMSDRVTESRLPPEEFRILKMLFEDGPTIELTPALDQRNTAQNTRYVFAIQQELAKRFGNLYFSKHAGAIILAVLATFLLAIIAAARSNARDTVGAIFFTVWALSAALLIGLVFEVAFWPACKWAARSGSGWIRLLPLAAALLAFLSVIPYMLRELARQVSTGFAAMLAGLILINLFCAPFLKRITPQGRQLLDQIVGFRLFLEIVEQDRLDRLNSREDTLQSPDQYLPYAIALELREAWGDHLAGTFAAASTMR